jgi:hypothetical protein
MKPQCHGSYPLTCLCNGHGDLVSVPLHISLVCGLRGTVQHDNTGGGLRLSSSQLSAFASSNVGVGEMISRVKDGWRVP